MFLKVLFRPLRPAQGHFHRFARPALLGRILRALIKRHDDVGSEPDLRRHRALRAEEVGGTVEMRPERHSLFADLPEFAKAEYLEATRVSQDRSPPRHESVQPAQLPELVCDRGSIKMVCVSQKGLNP